VGHASACQSLFQQPLEALDLYGCVSTLQFGEKLLLRYLNDLKCEFSLTGSALIWIAMKPGMTSPFTVGYSG
jgi:hypothetical protein